MEKMPSPLALTIKVTGIADIDPLDRPAQIRLRCFNQQMIMVGHQTIRVNLNCKPLNGFFKVFQELFSVSLVNKNILSGATSIDDMIKCARVLYSQSPGHRRNLLSGQYASAADFLDLLKLDKIEI